MKKMMKLTIAICDDNKLVLENEKALIEETLKEMRIHTKWTNTKIPKILLKMLGNTISILVWKWRSQRNCGGGKHSQCQQRVCYFS